MQLSTDISTKLNITARRRDTFTLEIDIQDADEEDFDFTTHTAKMDIMDEPDGTVILALTTSNGRIALTDGRISFTITALDMDIPEAEYVYDLQMTYPSGQVVTWFRGSFTVNNDVTA